MSLFLAGMVGEKHSVWPLEGSVFRIGRSSRHTIHIPDGTVSKDHAEITARDGRLWLRDLGSRNGTRVNGREARDPIALVAGDQVEIGHVTLLVTGDEAQPRLRLNEQSIAGTTLHLKAQNILEQRVKTGKSSGHLVHLLAEAGRLLVIPRPLNETCDELLQFVERAVPASRYIFLLDQGPDAQPLQIAARTRGGRADRALSLSTSIMRKVLEECTSVLTRDTASDPRFKGQQSIVAQSVQSAMAVPLFDNQKVLGILYVDSHELGMSFDDDQLELLTLLGNMAAVKITNARLLEAQREQDRIAQELQNATRIQRAMLRESTPELAGWDLDVFLETCTEVGGDLYDFHTRDDGRLVFLVGDVTGKGMGAALFMSSFLASARVLYDVCADPAELTRRLSNLLARTQDRSRYITGFVGFLDPATGTLLYVNAGHPSAMIDDGASLRELESGGVPFGTVPDFPYGTEETVLAPGETFAVFTDGIPEAQRGEDMFEVERLRDSFRREVGGGGDLPSMRQRLMEDVDEFLAGSPRTDDITLVLIRRQRA
ncbi:MAG TPA: SpoIIE family protein phosphatase [Candidatus Eisenbacteria bacterium]|nr:SpoIIE family protein phosphatase [Candidatus Eisenbacteria bacterium]